MPFIGKQGSTGNSKIKKYSFTATASQTAFSVSSDASDELQVFLNGVLLKLTDDYTYTTSTVTLGSGASVNDIIEVHVYQSFLIADAVKETGDTMTGELEVPTVKLSSNVIKASDGGSTITLDTSDNVTIAGGGTFGGTVDLQGNELILDADNDTSITADTNDQIDFRAGGTDSVKIGNEHLTINDGNLVIGTAGHGIDFSINSHQSGMTSELLSSYEEGTFSPTLLIGGSSASGTVDTGGTYIKIGNLVQVTLEINISSAQSGSSAVTIDNLPFTNASTSGFEGHSITAIRSNRIASSQNLPLIAQLPPSSTAISILTIKNSETSSSPGITGDNIGSSSILRLTLNYKTD